jgi:colanic acid biosynthesis glycosyl transferase WcaI
MAQAVMNLAANPDLRQAMGAAARVYAETHLDQAAVLTRFAAHLHALVQGQTLSPGLVADERVFRDKRA